MVNMKFYKVFKLKNGEELIIENAKVEDAEELTDIWNKTIRETKYLSRGDRDGYFDKEDALENINDYLDSDKVVYLVARYKNKIVGESHLDACLFKQRMKHRCDIGISVLKDYWGLGIGGRMMSCLVEIANNEGFEQIELNVAENNKRAIELYKAFGFIEMGRILNAFKYSDGTYDNYVGMVKFLKEQKNISKR
jgi:ribosomal protein S18 acetylase RimI-like enzyme